MKEVKKAVAEKKEEVKVEKTAAKKTATKAAEKKTATAAKKAVAKTAEKKVEKEVKAAAKKVVEKEVKATAKKAVTKKAAAKKTAGEVISLQYLGKDIKIEDLKAAVKKIWTGELKKKAADLETMNLYLKPEDKACYYVLNESLNGKTGI